MTRLLQRNPQMIMVLLLSITAAAAVAAEPFSSSIMTSGVNNGLRRVAALSNNNNHQARLDLIHRVRNEQGARALLQDTTPDNDYSPVTIQQDNTATRHLAQRWIQKNNNKHNNKHGGGERKLAFTGHLADLVLSGCQARDVFQFTNYTDDYRPICGCWQDMVTGEVLLRCNLNDDECQMVDVPEDMTEQFNSTDLLQQEICSATQEYYFFSDQDGDLETKATCQFCRDTDDATEELCANQIRELCTFVTFEHDTQDNNDQPVSCELAEYPANVSEPRLLCEDCQICQSNQGQQVMSYGIQHSCFDLSDGQTCDTAGFAHLHNFIPTLGADTGTVFAVTEGTYGEICQDPDDEEFSLVNALYDNVAYDNAFSKVCDCNLGTDPNSAIVSISCDLHYPQCFANTCTDLSEVFFFDGAGVPEAKWTVSWTTQFGRRDLWTQVEYNKETGEPTKCGVIDTGSSGQLVLCPQCEVCQNGDSVGINFDCFGYNTAGQCYTNEGRAQYNFADTTPFTPRPPGSPTVAPPPGTTPLDGSDDSDDDDDGVFYGLSRRFLLACAVTMILCLAIIFTLYRQHERRRLAEEAARAERRAAANHDDMTVASSIPDDDLSLAPSDQFVNNDAPPADNDHAPISTMPANNGSGEPPVQQDENRTGGGGLSEAQIC